LVGQLGVNGADRRQDCEAVVGNTDRCFYKDKTSTE
jgi:hypothetical protein